MKKVLLVNDDGIEAEGIRALAQALAGDYDIRVVAPAAQQSGMSQAISAHNKIKVERVEFPFATEAYKVYGTPADCCKIAFEVIYEKDYPDMVISGINDGGNLGTDILYSGTVGAAMEAYLHNVFSVAVSLVSKSELDFHEAAQIFKKELPKLPNDKAYLYNINFPKKIEERSDIFYYAKQGKRIYTNEYTVTDGEEDGIKYYYMNGTPHDAGNAEGTDIWAVKHGFVSITPLKVGRTHKIVLDELKK